MIITRTPLRISLVGGGTDMPAFYHRTPGAVVSFAIDKYIYVGVNEKFDGKLRVSYSRTENVNHPVELKHDIIREALLAYGIYSGEIVTIADIPGEGSGLGSSSALAVGLTLALCKLTGGNCNQHPSVYAEHAYHIERERCLHAIGKQDHFAAAYGDMHFFQFNQDESVTSKLINLNPDQLHELENRFVLLWTGKTRSAKDILTQQEKNFEEGISTAEEMRDMAISLQGEICRGDFSNIGAYLHDNWMRKKDLAHGISNAWLDEIYEKAIFAGAQGGKVCGAGGGGFFLFYGPFGLAQTLEQATGLKHVPFKIEAEGSKIIYG